MRTLNLLLVGVHVASSARLTANTEATLLLMGCGVVVLWLARRSRVRNG
jgi:hypothetical protein